MDEFGFRSTSGDSLSVSHTPSASSPASRKTTASRSNVSLYLSQPSRLPSPGGPSIGHSPAPLSSRANGKGSVMPTTSSASGSAGISRLRSLRNMLPFGPKQSNNNSNAAPSSTPLSRKPTNPSVPSTPAQTVDLKHRRSSSSIPTPSGMGGVSKHGFLSVGRRTSFSLHKEKTLPALPSLPRSHSEDLGSHGAPVMTISPSSTKPSNVDGARGGLPLSDDPFRRPSPSAAATTFFQRGSSREELGTIRSRGDLSTIIESELSNLSILKHSPPLNPYQGDCLQAQEDNESDKQMLVQLAEQDDKNNNLSIMYGQDTDVTAATADLSASWEAGIKELRQSLHLRVPGDRYPEDGRTSPSTFSVSPVSDPTSTQEQTPPTSVPVTSKSESEVQLNSPEVEQEGEVSFELSKVDPALAALLNPAKRSSRIEDVIVAAADSIEPPPPMNSSPSASPSPSPDDLGTRLSADLEGKWDAETSSRRASTNSRRRSVGMQSSPVRRSRPSSLVLSSDSLPVAHCTKKTSVGSTPMNGNVRQFRLSPTPRPGSTSPRTSYEDLTETIRRPGVLGTSHSVLSKRGPDLGKRRAHVARLYETPSRPSTDGSTHIGRVSSEGGRPFLSSARTSEERPPRVYSPISCSRPTTSLGMSSRTRNAMAGDPPERPATALSSIGRGPPPVPQRSRKRSLSATTDPRHEHPNAPDWMGPRTVRAFAAAGLLNGNTDHTKERHVPPPIPSRAESRMRMTNSRPSHDRDYRSLQTESAATSSYAPSRAGFSERSQPPSSIGRRRASSRVMTATEVASTRVESPVTSITSSSNARTVFSSSTATSLSCSSPHQQYQVAHLESEISSLKDKHSAEMAAILSALADSQRASKLLRDENSQLQGRIRDLEEQLADLAEQLEEARRQPPPPPLPSSLTRSLLRQHRSSPQGSPRGSPSRNRAFVRSPVDSLASDYDTTDAHTTMRENGGLLTPNFMSSSFLQSRENRPRTRASTTSSVFPVLPSNMSMLLHDDGSDSYSNPSGGLALLQSNAYSSSAGSPAASPTLNVNRLTTSSSIPNEKIRHATTLSLSSIEMSMLSSLPGSPKSLKLKPEHEKHLCDLKSLDFSVIDSD
ncbi:hypothetical protein ACEPAF_9306 [Sanghuangporus sanghuang]